MRKQHRKKALRPHSHKIALKRRAYAGFDNTKDIDLILSKGKLPQDLLGFSAERLGTLFETAVGLLQQHRYDEAVQGFDFLTRVNPYVADFWIGLGLAHLAREAYKPALGSFMAAQTMDPSREEPYTYAVDCCLEMKDFDQAQAILNQGLRYAKRHPLSDDSKSLLRELKTRQEEIERHRSNSR